jgi:hypothetical protein
MLTRRLKNTQQKLITLISGIALALFGVWYSSAAISLGSTEQNIVKNSIAAEYQRYHLSRNDLTATQKASLLGAIQNMQIRSLSARGDPDSHLIVRVEVEPTTAKPPGFANVLYYRLNYSPLTGWSNQGRATAEEYYLSYVDLMNH